MFDNDAMRCRCDAKDTFLANKRHIYADSDEFSAREGKGREQKSITVHTIWVMWETKHKETMDEKCFHSFAGLLSGP